MSTEITTIPDDLRNLIGIVTSRAGMRLSAGELAADIAADSWYTILAREAYTLGRDHATGEPETKAAAETPTVRTYRVQLIPGSEDGDTGTYVDAETFERIEQSHRRWVAFTRDGRTVAEVTESAIVLIEEMQPLNPSEREELESLRETVAILNDPDAVADLARAMAETREAAVQDRERRAQPRADWAAYGECPGCHKPTGEACVTGDLTHARWPHRDRPLLAPAEATVGDGEQTDWSAYHPCGTCLQQTGESCRFVRFEGRVGEARINPHLNRERLTDVVAA